MLKIILAVLHMPQQKLDRGSNGYVLAYYLTDKIEDIMEIHGSASETVVSEVSKYVKDKISPVPPNYFMLGKLKKVDIEEKTITIEASNKIPVGNCGYGVAANIKAVRIMCDLFGILTPTY